MGNYNHMLAQHHGLCGPECMSRITELYHCCLVHGNRPTILVVDADRGAAEPVQREVSRGRISNFCSTVLRTSNYSETQREQKRQTTG